MMRATGLSRPYCAMIRRGARGYFCASSGTVTDEMIKEYLESHRGRGPDPDFRVEVPE